MLIQAIRSAIFYILFIGQTAILAFLMVITIPLNNPKRQISLALARYWTRSNLFYLRWLIGIKSVVTGLENIPESGCIIAAKHQSDWDIFALFPVVPDAAFIAKKELMDIPFFGRAARQLNTITVNRKGGGDAIKAMSTSAKEVIARGCHIIIFPEGTRRAPLADPAYKFGISRLYEDLDVPIVPVALNSGLVWSRNSLILWPGTATARFLEPIQPGLTGNEMKELMIQRIESATDALILEEVEKGLAAPLSAEQHKKLAALRKATSVSE